MNAKQPPRRIARTFVRTNTHPGEGQHDHSSSSCISDSLRNPRARSRAGRGRRATERVRSDRRTWPHRRTGRMHREDVERCRSGRARATSTRRGLPRISSSAIQRARSAAAGNCFSASAACIEGLGPRVNHELDGRHSRDAPARRRIVGQLRRVSRPAARLSRRRRRRRDVSRQSRCAASIRLGVDRDARRRDDDGPARDSRASAARSANRHRRDRRPGQTAGETGSTVARLAPAGRPRASASAGSRRIPTAAWIRPAVRGVDANLRVRPFLHQGGDGVDPRVLDRRVSRRDGPAGVGSRAVRGDRSNCSESSSEHRGLQVRSRARRVRAAACCAAPPRTSTAIGKANEIDPALVDYVEFYLLELLQAGPVPRHAARCAGRANHAAHRLHGLPRAELDGAQRPAHRRRRDSISTRSAASSTTCSRPRRRCSAACPTRLRIRSCSRSADSSSCATCSRT